MKLFPFYIPSILRLASLGQNNDGCQQVLDLEPSNSHSGARQLFQYTIILVTKRCSISLLQLPWRNFIDWEAYSAKNHFLPFWRVEVQDQSARDWFQVKLLPLACRMAAFLLCPHKAFSSVHTLHTAGVSLLKKALVLLDQGPTLLTSFNPSYLLKDVVSKHSHVGGWSFSINFKETQFSLLQIRLH